MHFHFYIHVCMACTYIFVCTSSPPKTKKLLQTCQHSVISQIRVNAPEPSLSVHVLVWWHQSFVHRPFSLNNCNNLLIYIAHISIGGQLEKFSTLHYFALPSPKFPLGLFGSLPCFLPHPKTGGQCSQTSTKIGL